MQRYFAVNNYLELSSSDIYHIYKVMRMRPKDKIEIIYDRVINVCELTNVDTNKVEFNVIDKRESEADLPYSVTIAISLVTEQKWDYILQKSTELGADEIIPLTMARTLIKLDDKKSDKKYERWAKICKEASEQSHRTTIPSILNIMTIQELANTDYDLKIICSTQEDAISIKEVLSNNSNYGKILVVIGPEGGITPHEEQVLVDKGFIRTSLGKLILRVETAPLYILSVMNYELTR